MTDSTHFKVHILTDILGIKNAYPIKKEYINLIDVLMNVKFHFPITKNEGIYKIVLKNGSWYIGKSKNIIKRIWEHLCSSIDAKSNKEFYDYLAEEIIINNEIIVLKLSDNIEDEYKLLDIHLNTDNNYCFNKIKNIKILSLIKK
jgi:excinuclease UvrABC nuclease subunit